jgi:two-component system cell cycle response regulator DivK
VQQRTWMPRHTVTAHSPGARGADRLEHRKARVLIVDDAVDNREAYAEYLRFRGFDVFEAATGEEALAKASRSRPHIVLLDMRLPDVSGKDVCRQLRAMRTDRPTIIAVSACTFENDVTAALMSGCDAFLAKPCLPETLEREIRRHLRARAVA